jgi:hypothetical protein
MRAAAGWISVFLGLGFGIPCAFGLRHFAQTGEVWTFMGFPTYGGGPFERIGVETTTGLLVGFLVVCVAQLVAGGMLVMDAPYASLLSWVLLPFEFAFWIGFALPVGIVLGLVAAVLLLVSGL